MSNFTVSPSKRSKIMMAISSIILPLLIVSCFYLIITEGLPFEGELSHQFK